jgi:hypothetical protein
MLTFTVQFSDDVVDDAYFVIDFFIDELKVKGRVDRKKNRRPETISHNYYSSY